MQQRRLQALDVVRGGFDVRSTKIMPQVVVLENEGNRLRGAAVCCLSRQMNWIEDSSKQ